MTSKDSGDYPHGLAELNIPPFGWEVHQTAEQRTRTGAQITKRIAAASQVRHGNFSFLFKAKRQSLFDISPYRYGLICPVTAAQFESFCSSVFTCISYRFHIRGLVCIISKYRRASLSLVVSCNLVWWVAVVEF